MKYGKKKINKYKIGVFGSNAEELSQNTIVKAKKAGRMLSNYNIIVINGASSGLPYYVAYEAAKLGVEVWGYSPKLDIKGQRAFTPNIDLSIYKKIFFVPSGFEFANNLEVCKKYRNVISTANCDAGIIISGRWGTLNEFTNLYDMGKIIGVLTKTGGVADELPELTKTITKKSKAKVIFSPYAEELLGKLIKKLNNL